MKVASMWSGGKDSTLATYAAVLQGHEISGLVSYSYKQTSQVNLKAAYKPLSHIVNFARRTAPSVVNNIASVIYRKDLSTMIPHVISSETIAKQAEAIELPLIHGEVTWDTIDQFIKISIKALKDKGIEGVVFGVAPPHFPIDTSEKLREYRSLLAHKEWMNQICRDLDVELITPLWDITPEQILNFLVAKGFEPVIIVVDSKYYGEEWLGRKIDRDFLDAAYKLKREKSIHIGGSGYHTLVLDGPIFKKRLEILKSRKICGQGYGVYKIDKLNLVAK